MTWRTHHGSPAEASRTTTCSRSPASRSFGDRPLRPQSRRGVLALDAICAGDAHYATSLEVPRGGDDSELTPREIGARIGVSQMHVSRILRAAIAALSETAETLAPAEAAW